MKIKLSQTDIFTALLCLTGMIPGIMFYSELPEKLPVHFDINDEPSNFADKAFVIFAIPLLMAVFQLVCCAFAFNREGDKVPKKLIQICRFIIPFITIFLQTLTVMYALDRRIKIGVAVMIFLSVLMIIIGNYLPKCRKNSVFGIKFPSTLKSDHVWDKTHRLAGLLYIISGITAIPLSLADMLIPAFTVIMCALLIPIAYSFAAANNENRS